MIRQNKSSPCYEGHHDQCRVVYSGRTKKYDPDKAEFYYVTITDWPCGCICHPRVEVAHAV